MFHTHIPASDLLSASYRFRHPVSFSVPTATCIYCPEVIMSFVALPRLIHLWRCLKAYLIYTQKYLLLPVELGCTTCLSTSTSVERSKISSYRSSKGNVFSYSKLSEEPSESSDSHEPTSWTLSGVPCWEWSTSWMCHRSLGTEDMPSSGPYY